MKDVRVVEKPGEYLYAERRLAAAVIVSALRDLKSGVDLERLSARRFFFHVGPESNFEKFAEFCGYDAGELRSGIVDRLRCGQSLEVVRYKRKRKGALLGAAMERTSGAGLLG